MLPLKPLTSARIVILRVVPEVLGQGGSGMPIAKVRTPPPSATADTMTIITRVLFGNKCFPGFRRRCFYSLAGFVANRVLAIMQNEVMQSKFVIVLPRNNRESRTSTMRCTQAISDKGRARICERGYQSQVKPLTRWAGRAYHARATLKTQGSGMDYLCLRERGCVIPWRRPSWVRIPPPAPFGFRIN